MWPDDYGQLIGQFSMNVCTCFFHEWLRNGSTNEAAQLRPFTSLTSSCDCVGVQKISQISFFFSPLLIIADIFALPLSYHWDSPWNAIWRCSVHFPGCKVPCWCRFRVGHLFEFRHFDFLFFFLFFALVTISPQLSAHCHFNYPVTRLTITFVLHKAIFFFFLARLFLSIFSYGREFDVNLKFPLIFITKLDRLSVAKHF